jgi:hypothetical protein
VSRQSVGATVVKPGLEGIGGTSIVVRGSRSVHVVVDIGNVRGCGDRPFVDKAVLSPSAGGSSVSGEAAGDMLWTPRC